MAESDVPTAPITLMDLDRLLQAATRIAHDIPGNSPERNLVKLAEETGELARTWTRQMPREAVIEEACDVVITALVAAGFADASTDEIVTTLERKIARSLTRCTGAGDDHAT
jgi:NTP pyrophosphatase (non-canonical NTP hydrolase)